MEANWNDTQHPLVRDIQHRTVEANRNNVTRTEAYRQCYQQCPEIHWAYLAHMVSRNGGWSMTDLKGDMLPRLMSERLRTDIFLFLERCNWLIFQDAYPQLLLYKKSKDEGIPLFDFLPAFGVSAFMHHMWSEFWQTGDARKLAYALIINEQNYIERRVCQNRYIQHDVLRQPLFQAQSLLHFNQLHFPFVDPSSGHVHLAGTVMNDFEDIDERIGVGKHLYAILFDLEGVKEGIKQWSEQKTHTGSRADIWPHLFSIHPAQDERSSVYSPHLRGEQLHEGMPPLYSPVLAQAWPEKIFHLAAGQRDWAQDTSVKRAWFDRVDAAPYDLTDEYTFQLNRMELAVVLKEKSTSLFDFS